MTEEEKKKRQSEACKRYYQKNREKKLAYNKMYNEKHREERNRKSNEYHKAHKEEHRIRESEWVKNNKERFKEICRKWSDSIKQPVVYRYLTLDNELAYIGSTCCLSRRIYNRLHSMRTCKFDYIYRENPELYTLEIVKEFDTLEEARAYERKLIEELHPKYNVEFNR